MTNNAFLHHILNGASLLWIGLPRITSFVGLSQIPFHFINYLLAHHLLQYVYRRDISICLLFTFVLSSYLFVLFTFALFAFLRFDFL